MKSSRASEIMRSKGVINVSYKGVPVWLETMHGDEVEITFIGQNKRTSVPVSAIDEFDPLQMY